MRGADAWTEDGWRNPNPQEPPEPPWRQVDRRDVPSQHHSRVPQQDSAERSGPVRAERSAERSVADSAERSGPARVDSDFTSWEAAWCESGNGSLMLFINADKLSQELLAVAKSACGSLAYWQKDLDRHHSVELKTTDDGGWDAEVCPSGHCQVVRLPKEAGKWAGLRSAVIGSNKKIRGMGLAISVLITASATREGITSEDLHRFHPELVLLKNAACGGMPAETAAEPASNELEESEEEYEDDPEEPVRDDECEDAVDEEMYDSV